MNRVTLYIAGQEVELDNTSLILYNYKLEDMSNPTIVENSYSQSVTIQGTPNNNKIFGGLWRLDRMSANSAEYTGIGFDPARKTPFTICDSTGAQIESGYIKLNSITRTATGIPQYKITLYGGLGSFLYGLSYNDNGDKMTLASLQYLNTTDPTEELTFTINKTAVTQAWSELSSSRPLSFTSKWQCINFAPAYNGIPNENFSADKALIVPSDHNLPASKQVTSDGSTKTYTTRLGYSLVNLNNEHDEWACKDLRSYLQRPVLSIAAFLNAIVKAGNVNGYTVNIDSVKDLDYANTWLTLPLLPNIGSYKQSTGALTATITSSSTQATNIATISLNGTISSGTTITSKFTLALKMNCAGSELELVWRQSQLYNMQIVSAHWTVGFLQLVGYDADNNMICGSQVHTIGDIGSYATPQACALGCNFTPWYNADTTAFATLTEGTMKLDSGAYVLKNGSNVAALIFELSGVDVVRYELKFTAYQTVQNGGATARPEQKLRVYPNRTVTQPTPIEDITPTGSFVVRNSSDVITYTSSETLRSNAIITKAMLLSTSNTPADYLLSLCKVFGWYFMYDQLSRTVAIKTRNDMFDSSSIVDLTDRIATNKNVEILPYGIDSKWYEFSLGSVGGSFSESYEALQGRAYGNKRINTGYEFNSETKDLLSSVVFKTAVPTLETNKYNCVITKNASYLPSVFLDAGNTYTLWTSAGVSEDFTIPQPDTNSSVAWMNTKHGYDISGAWKMQFRDAENSAVEGEGVLLFYNGKKQYSHYKVSDDISAMSQLNDGKPCWLLGFDVQNPDLSVPIFSTYKTSAGGTAVTRSMDFGVPFELNIPDITYTEDKTIYHTAWRDYIADKYNKETKVLTVYIDFRGMKVDQSLLRKFYFYDGALWIINKISNYSMTTYDPCKCELVKVQDISNYTNGQDY